jgi:hypothetical protein
VRTAFVHVFITLDKTFSVFLADTVAVTDGAPEVLTDKLPKKWVDVSYFLTVLFFVIVVPLFRCLCSSQSLFVVGFVLDLIVAR